MRKCYVDGRVHTNGLENFWSLLKRSLKGTYVSVEPFHLFRYLDEQVFRFNARNGNDLGRFVTVLARVSRSEERRVGKEWRARWVGCQAEDGIRDRNVTGVQTCALPI